MARAQEERARVLMGFLSMRVGVAADERRS